MSLYGYAKLTGFNPIQEHCGKITNMIFYIYKFKALPPLCHSLSATYNVRFLKIHKTWWNKFSNMCFVFCCCWCHFEPLNSENVGYWVNILVAILLSKLDELRLEKEMNYQTNSRKNHDLESDYTKQFKFQTVFII